MGTKKVLEVYVVLPVLWEILLVTDKVFGLFKEVLVAFLTK